MRDKDHILFILIFLHHNTVFIFKDFQNQVFLSELWMDSSSHVFSQLSKSGPWGCGHIKLHMNALVNVPPFFPCHVQNSPKLSSILRMLQRRHSLVQLPGAADQSLPCLLTTRSSKAWKAAGSAVPVVSKPCWMAAVHTLLILKCIFTITLDDLKIKPLYTWMPKMYIELRCDDLDNKIKSYCSPSTNLKINR